MAANAVETWLKVALFLLGLVLIAFTLYAVLSLPEPSTEDRKSSGFVNRFIRNRRNAEKDCLWILVAKEGVRTLTSPNYPDSYPNNADCRWLINTQDENSTISIKIDTLSIESETECRLDYLQVYLGDNTLAPTLGPPLCGNIRDRLLDTNSSILLLVFRSDTAYPEAGFSIDYYVRSQSGTDCRELLTEGSNWLTSPKFPDHYPDDADCSTLIRVERDKKIVLVFDSMDLEYGDSCTFDYVQVFDGNSKNSTLLGQICQQTDNTSFESSSNSLLVHFHSDNSVHRKGYRARYMSVDARSTPIGNCMWERGDRNGTLSSPNYPENYPSFANCSLWLLAPVGSRVFIAFDALLLEMVANCSYDFLEVREGPEQGGRLLGRFCGRRSEPKHLVSEGHEVQILFESDSFLEFLGFQLRYEFLQVEASELKEDDDKDQSPEEAFSFSVKPSDSTLSFGSSHALHCGTRHPNAKIRWLKGELFLAGENPLPGLKVLANNTLWIQSMGRHLVGLYSCIAVSPEGVIEAKANLVMQDKQDELPCRIDFRKTPRDSEFEEGSFAHLECLPTVPQARMSWTKDGRPLVTQDRITVLKNGYVFMDSVRTGDAGLYTCVAEDPETGCSRRASARLKVNAKSRIEDICGKPKIEESAKNASHSEHAKIIGGYNAKKGAYPWQVMLWAPRHQSFCGGTLLNERWIVTAAHCLVNDLNIPWDTIRIRLGKYDRERTEEQELETTIADESAVVLHPGFNRFTYDNDLALIRMRQRLSFTDYILPVCLGDRNLSEFLLNGDSSRHPRMGTVIGWGKLKEKGASPRYLQEIKLPLVDPVVCRESTTYSVTRNMFCAGYSQEVIGDACQGDSGGPFLMKHEGKWYMVGIVSWGEGCGTLKKYGFYTRIANHLSWIEGIMKS